MKMANEKIGDYRVTETFTPEHSFLARDRGDRLVVLKFIERDCLLRGQLHPNIRDRLGRVRELAHLSVANLLAVERADERVLAVWQYVPGQTLEQWAAKLDFEADLQRVANETRSAMERLHHLGIVHGRIHARNVIVDEQGHITLTHVSPLMYDDPAVDERDFLVMIKSVAGGRCADSPAGQTAAESDAHERWAAPRRRAYLSAAIAALLAIALAISVIYLVQRRAAPRSIIPPEAPPSAMQPR